MKKILWKLQLLKQIKSIQWIEFDVKKVGEIAMNFFPIRRGFHFISLRVKVNVLGIPQWGMPGGFKWLVHYSSSCDSSCWISSCSKTCSVHSSKSFIKCRWMNPLHATWLLSLNNHVTGSVGKRRHIARGWSKDAILLALLNISASCLLRLYSVMVK